MEGKNCDEIVVKASNGHIEKTWDCKYIFTSDNSVFRTLITTGIKKGKKIRWVDSQYVAVIPLPDPKPFFEGIRHSGDTVIKYLFTMFLTDIQADTIYHPTLWIEGRNVWERHTSVNEVVLAFNVLVYRKDSLIFMSANSGAQLQDKARDFLLTELQSHDKVVFDHIVCEMYRREKRELKIPYIFYLK